MHSKKGENDEPTRKADSLLSHASPLSGMEAHARARPGGLAHCTDRRVRQGQWGERHSHRVSDASPTASSVNIAKLSVITVTAYDYSFAMPTTIPAGLTVVKLVNAGAQPHQASFGRIKPGVTLDQVLAAAKRGASAELYIYSALDFAGGPNTSSPQSQQETILHLRPGHYVALCFVPGPDGMPHYQMGMITPFTVTAASGQAPKGEPTADALVRLVDFGFVIPTGLKKGGLVNVLNQRT